MKRYTGIEISKISNGWLVDISWKEEEEGKEETNYGEDRIFCSTQDEVMKEVEKRVGLLE